MFKSELEVDEGISCIFTAKTYNLRDTAQHQTESPSAF